MPHVDDGTLHALLDGALRADAPGRADAVEAHLDACADCRARLDRAAALRHDAADVLAALDAELEGPGATGATGPHTRPDFGEVLARADAPTSDRGTTGSPDSDRARLRRRLGWTRGLAWAATIVVALGTGYIIRDLAGPTGEVPRATRPVVTDTVRPRTQMDEAAATAFDARNPNDRAAQETPRPELGAPKTAGAGGDAGPTGSERLGRSAPEPGQETERPQAGLIEADALEDVAASDATADPAWRRVSRAEADARLGTLLLLPGAELAELEAADGAVRSRQRLSGGVEVRVVQTRAPSSGPVPAAGEETVEPAATGATEAAPAAAPAADQPARARTQSITVDVLRRVTALSAEAAVEGRGLDVVPAMAPAEAAPTLLSLDSAAATVAEPVTVTVVRSDGVLTLTGSLPADVLRALATLADGG